MKKSIICLIFSFLVSSEMLAQDSNQSQAEHAVERGWQYFNRGDVETALKRFNQARIIDKEFAPAYFGTAYVLSTQGNLDKAIGFYEKTITLEPEFPHSYSNLGLALIYQGKMGAAFKHLNKAIELVPNDGDVNVNMAVWHYEAGQYAKAWKHVKAAVKYGANVNNAFIKDLSLKMVEPK